MASRFVFALIIGWSTVALAEYKIGLVDMQAAIEKTRDGQKAKKSLEEDFGRRKKDLEKMEADIKKASEEFEKKALVLSEDVKAKKQQEIQLQIRGYQEAVSKNQMEMQKRQQTLTEPIIQKLRKIIAEIAKKENLTIVQEKSEQLILYSAKELDLTDRVIAGYDSGG